MMNDLRGKTIIVTGGAQGIGKGVARRLLSLDAAVLMADSDAEAGAETVAEYAGLGELRFVQTDVSDETAVMRMVAELQRWLHFCSLQCRGSSPGRTSSWTAE
ncbi:MAG: SDR family NAD(P)-dependent oxidoreductase [Caldilinea sp.]|nr:SDR family NAD(P)-dependent oxidoreductase [Caldilinea sp.]